MKNNITYKIYFAGDLFDQKHVTGNLLLAQQIEKVSNGRYKCILPQDWEGNLNSSIEIRNRDINAVIHADLAIFNFDGVDLDSGTVVEFMVAKMLDIPAVLLRTDIRNGGHLFGDDWNLMVNGFPRCKTVKNPALLMYNKLGLTKMHQTVAESIVAAFSNIAAEESLFSSREMIFSAYQHVIKMCGAGLDKMIDVQAINTIITSKIEKNIYSLAFTQDKTMHKKKYPPNLK